MSYEKGAAFSGLYAYNGAEMGINLDKPGSTGSAFSNARGDMINSFNDGNNKAGLSLFKSASSVDKNDLGLSLSGASGSALAGALGIDPKIGDFVGKIGFSIGNNLLGKKPDSRAGQRNSKGFGLKPDNVIEPYSFKYKGQNFVVKEWGIRKSFWSKTDTADYEGYAMYRDGKLIADHVKYTWIDDKGDLYIQNNLAPWDGKEVAGTINVYIGRDDFMWQNVGRGKEPQALADNVKNATPNTNFERKSTQEPEKSSPNISPSVPTATMDEGAKTYINNILPGNPIDWSGKNNAPAKKEEPKDQEKKDNTGLVIGIGVGLLAVVVIVIVLIKK